MVFTPVQKTCAQNAYEAEVRALQGQGVKDGRGVTTNDMTKVKTKVAEKLLLGGFICAGEPADPGRARGRVSTRAKT